VLWVLAACFAFAFVVVPLNAAYRTLVNADGARLSPSQVLSTAGASVKEVGQITEYGSGPLATAVRVSRIGDLAIVVQRTPSSIAYRSVWELVEAPILGVIPRAIWPDKPVLTAGYDFSQQYYGLPATTYTSSAVTPEGDLWRHGGWLTLVVGMALLGAGLRFVDAIIGSIKRHPTGVLLVLALFATVVKHETDMISLIASIPGTLIACGLAARIVTDRRVAASSTVRPHGSSRVYTS
jgi:hypothetical protein